MKSDSKKWFNRVKRLITRYTFALNIALVAIGIILIILGFWAIDAMAVWHDIFVNIGCALVASGIVAFIIYPSLESDEYYQIRGLIDNDGFMNIFRGNEYLRSSNKQFKDAKNSISLITDSSSDLKALASLNNIPGKLRIRVLVKQPNLNEKSMDFNDFQEWSNRNNKNVEVKYFHDSNIDWYCNIDDVVYLRQLIDKNNESSKIVYEFSKYCGIGEESSNLFEIHWNGSQKSHLISEYRSGRYKGSQSECITRILQFFSENAKNDLQLNKDIEAVVAIWTENKILRRTFYSCNKTDEKDLHNTRPYNMGVVGILQGIIEKRESEGNDTRDCIILYDIDNNERSCEVVYDWRDINLININCDKQKFKDRSTRAILAVSLSKHTSDGKNEIFGALSFDFAETLKDKSTKDLESLFQSVIDCRNIILPLLSSTIDIDFEEQLIKLEKAEAQSESENKKESKEKKKSRKK